MVRGICIVLSTAVLLGCTLLAVAVGQKTQWGTQTGFVSPEKAAEALFTAYKGDDVEAMVKILGPKGHRLVHTGDSVEDRIERDWFVSLYEESHSVFSENESRAVLQLGRDEQPYPIPIVKKGGKWGFDPSEGHEELLTRRISKNELSALNLVVAYVEAQQAYCRIVHDGEGELEYAQRIRSSKGNHDGLYWKTEPEGQESPVASFAEMACNEGYSLNDPDRLPYRGYYYKILKAQGPNAPGGAVDYMENGKMVRGFALVAYPARYNISGIMTFMVNQDGVVYQKDLGPKTVSIAQQMTTFDPDRTWTRGQQ